MTYEDWQYHPTRMPKVHSEIEDLRAKLEKQFQEELKNDPEYKNFFKSFTTDSVKSFIQVYATRKAYIIINSRYYIQKGNETKELRYRIKTEAVFDLILQKKLFNKQLEWRARKIELPQIRLSYDFYLWQKNIHHCPFIDDVTEAEIEVMKQFLRSNNYNDQTQHWLYQWQDYRDIIKKNNDGDYEMMPEWYEFYDGMMGTGTLLLLPDLRGPIEEKYIHAGSEKRQEEYQSKIDSGEIKIEPVAPTIPYLNFGGTQLLSFANRFEKDPIIIRLFKALKKQYDEIRDKSDVKEDIDKSVDLLLEAEEPIYMPGGLEWKEAIHKCAQQYINTIIAAELDSIYEEYMMMRQMNIWGEIKKDAYESDNFVIKSFLEGRKLFGEPENFDY